MLYVNQIGYPHIPYNHDLNNGGRPLSTIASSGCGLCSACMIVDHLVVGGSLSIEECRQLSYDSKANLRVGTDIHILGAVLAEKFNLDFEMTNDINKLVTHLQNGGEAIVNVAADENGVGIFTKGGHYIVATAYVNGEIEILDPSFTRTKYTAEHCQGKVRIVGPFVYSSPETLASESVPRREHPFYLFKRKA